jgi:8-oxo-dGTP diphosphatase
MTRTPVLAAGGIVLRQARPPLIAVVRLRKGNEWVLPKGKLDDGETPRDAAEREVLEETGHDVSVHEFLGTLAYDAGGRSKIVHYWRMETNGGQSRDLMGDVRAVDWLPLEAAVERLSRDHERAFLANVGPLALEAAKRSGERKAPAPAKRRRRAVAPKPSLGISAPAEIAALLAEQPRLGEHDAIKTGATETGSFVSSASGQGKQRLRIDLMRKVRAWLQRVA